MAKGRDVNLAAGKVAAAQMDALELERLAQRERLLQHRLANLEIKSPIDGAVIGGDLKRSEGVPLSIGQPLYEIGPIERMVAQIDIPQAELSHVRAGQSVEIELEAYPGKVWTASIERIHPRSESREGANVFVAEVVIENAEMLIRPGMRGKVRVTTSRQPIAWIVFHAPWRDFLHWSGW